MFDLTRHYVALGLISSDCHNFAKKKINKKTNDDNTQIVYKYISFNFFI